MVGGATGSGLRHDDREACEIDTFLLSCRVIGRNVETALLSHVTQAAAGRGMKSVRGWFFPTKKNAPAKEFYAQHGFTLTSTSSAGSLWTLDLQTSRVECPEWVKLSVLQEKA